MELVMEMKPMRLVQLIEIPLENVLMERLLIVQMMIAVMKVGLEMVMVIVKIKPMDVI
jgi:hypothetical protein